MKGKSAKTGVKDRKISSKKCKKTVNLPTGFLGAAGALQLQWKFAGPYPRAEG